MMDFISSSLTLLSVVFLMPINFNNKLFELVKTHTNGDVTIDKTFIGIANKIAMGSGKVMPSLLGNNSPKTMDR